jgi:hypothetical protein
MIRSAVDSENLSQELQRGIEAIISRTSNSLIDRVSGRRSESASKGRCV